MGVICRNPSGGMPEMGERYGRDMDGIVVGHE